MSPRTRRHPIRPPRRSNRAGRSLAPRTPHRVHLGLLLLALASAGLASRAGADGGLIAPPGVDLWEPAQQALILYDPDAGTETMVLRVAFEGSAEEFGWIVPVPAIPELAPADEQLFWDLAYLTAPLARNRDGGWGCLGGSQVMDAAGDAQDGEVTIYGTERVGVYQTITVGASDAALLADSLTAWGYLHDENRARVEAALQFYIDRTWAFVALRMDPLDGSGGVSGSTRHGALDPIRLTFAAQSPVYPLRISAISAPSETQVLLYVAAAHRMTFPEARTEYANRLTATDLADLRNRFPTLGAVLVEPCFITKLRCTYLADELTEDIVFERAADDREFREIFYTGLPTSGVFLLATAGIFGLRAWRRGARATGRPRQA